MARTPLDTPVTSAGKSSRTELAVRPVLDVVTCDGADATPVLAAAQVIQAEVRLTATPEVWLEQLSRARIDHGVDPADVVIFVGAANRVVSQRWIARGCATTPDTKFVAAIIDASLEHAMAVVNQGAQGLLVLPGLAEGLAQHLREIVEPAVRCRESRLEVLRHRRAAAALTPAEQDVLEGMLSGMPNKQIAQRLSIGLRTVELRRSKIMKKMKAKSLAQLISFICMAQHQGC